MSIINLVRLLVNPMNWIRVVMFVFTGRPVVLIRTPFGHPILRLVTTIGSKRTALTGEGYGHTRLYLQSDGTTDESEWPIWSGFLGRPFGTTVPLPKAHPNSMPNYRD
jgi:hypothetical protein